MPSGISLRGNAQKCLILLVEIYFLQNSHSGKSCCDLRSKEIFRQRSDRVLSCGIVDVGPGTGNSKAASDGISTSSNGENLLGNSL